MKGKSKNKAAKRVVVNKSSEGSVNLGIFRFSERCKVLSWLE